MSLQFALTHTVNWNTPVLDGMYTTLEEAVAKAARHISVQNFSKFEIYLVPAKTKAGGWNYQSLIAVIDGNSLATNVNYRESGANHDIDRFSEDEDA